MTYHKIQKHEWKEYEVELEIRDDLLFLRVLKAISEEDAIEQVMRSDDLYYYDEDDLEHMNILSIQEVKGFDLFDESERIAKFNEKQIELHKHNQCPRCANKLQECECDYELSEG